MPAGLHRLRVAATAAGLVSRWVEVLLLDGQPLGSAQAALDPTDAGRARRPSCGRTPSSTRSCSTASATATAPTTGPSWRTACCRRPTTAAATCRASSTPSRPATSPTSASTRCGSRRSTTTRRRRARVPRAAPLLHRLPRLLAEPPARGRRAPGRRGAAQARRRRRARPRPARAARRRRPPRPRLAPLCQQHPDWFGRLELPDGSLNLRRWDDYRLTTWFEPYLPTFDFAASPATSRRSRTTPSGGSASRAPTASATTP